MNNIELYEDISELENNFPIKVRKYTNHILLPHWHEHIELLYLIDGQAEFSCNTKTIEAHSGETIVVNSNELHSFHSGRPIEYICILVNPIIFEKVSNKNIILESKIHQDEFITDSFTRIYKAYESNNACANMIIMGEIYLLMAYLSERHTAALLSEIEYVNRINRMKKVNSLLDYIHENYKYPITTSDLALKWYISESHLCKIFKNAAGVSLLEYINRFRIDKAAVLLKNTDEDISKIAQNVGFENLNYFDRIFKKYKGMSPGKYRSAIKPL